MRVLGIDPGGVLGCKTGALGLGFIHRGQVLKVTSATLTRGKWTDDTGYTTPDVRDLFPLVASVDAVVLELPHRGKMSLENLIKLSLSAGWLTGIFPPAMVHLQRRGDSLKRIGITGNLTAKVLDEMVRTQLQMRLDVELPRESHGNDALLAAYAWSLDHDPHVTNRHD